jgi:hypothetical protein
MDQSRSFCLKGELVAGIRKCVGVPQHLSFQRLKCETLQALSTINEHAVMIIMGCAKMESFPAVARRLLKILKLCN